MDNTHSSLVSVPLPNGDGQTILMVSFRSLSVASVLRMAEMSREEDAMKQMLLVAEFTRDALMRPEDWDDHLSSLNVDEFMEFVNLWAAVSP
jgi:hypothetical protein